MGGARFCVKGWGGKEGFIRQRGPINEGNLKHALGVVAISIVFALMQISWYFSLFYLMYEW